MAAAAGVTGLRSWLQTRRWTWLTPQLLRRITITAFVVGLLVTTVTLSGSSKPTASHAGTGAEPASRVPAKAPHDGIGVLLRGT